MIPEFIRSVREIAPRAFIMENVKGLTRKTFANYFTYIKLQLSYPNVLRKPRETWQRHLDRLEDIHTRGGYGDLKYNVVARLLNSADYGVPQVRERVFVVGFRSDLGVEWHFPESTHSEDALVHDQWVSGEYWRRHHVRRPSEEPTRSLGRVTRLRREDPPTLSPWRTVRDAIAGLPEPRADRESDVVLNHRLQPGARAYVGHTGSPLDAPSKTLKAGVHGVPGGENMIAFPDGKVRYLTVREAARVQTFPDGWRFYGAWSEVMRQLGNAAPMHLGSVVAVSVANKLRERDARG
jgi:DNA (cytosine-5)-methyltransferase 1